jgi:hypothetical protein
MSGSENVGVNMDCEKLKILNLRKGEVHSELVMYSGGSTWNFSSCCIASGLRWRSAALGQAGDINQWNGCSDSDTHRSRVVQGGWVEGAVTVLGEECLDCSICGCQDRCRETGMGEEIEQRRLCGAQRLQVKLAPCHAVH